VFRTRSPLARGTVRLRFDTSSKRDTDLCESSRDYILATINIYSTFNGPIYSNYLLRYIKLVIKLVKKVTFYYYLPLKVAVQYSKYNLY